MGWTLIRMAMRTRSREGHAIVCDVTDGYPSWQSYVLSHLYRATLIRGTSHPSMKSTTNPRELSTSTQGAHPVKLNTANRSTPPQNSKPATPGSGQTELQSVSFARCIPAAVGPLLHWHASAFSTPAKRKPRWAHAWRHWLMKSRLVSNVLVVGAENAGASCVSTMQPW